MDCVDFSEKIAHGNPSGIDAAATSGNEAIYFYQRAADYFFSIDDRWLFVSRRYRDRKVRPAQLSKASRICLKRKNTKTSQAISRLGSLAKTAKEAILHNQLTQLGQAMTHAHETLRQLGVSNQNLDDLVSLALANGALAQSWRAVAAVAVWSLWLKKTQAEVISRILLSNGAHATWIQGLGAYEHVYKGKARAYTNIALIKYWGKGERNTDLANE